ncbi:Flp pilus assembly protein CpaB [Botrimarina sp.]|uniref:Flp pilus assembly protein CpaB n=1 Tax=Botrimarina sp. TaxID=2795802 RepID=UPI0032ED6030
MRPKSLLLLAFALGSGLAASIAISRVMDAKANGGVELDTTPIYVARHNINLGDPISAEMVALDEWPTDKAPKGSITALEDLEGRRPRTTIVAGTPILEAQLLAQGETADPVANIPDGFRLSTIKVDAEKSAAGLLSPGDRVDVQLYVAASQRAGIPEAKTRVILQNIRVFAVEQAVQRSADGEESKAIPKTVSLLVTPTQATTINLAQNAGELSLIPRNPNDESVAEVADITLTEILGGRSERNSREEEQNRESSGAPKPSFLDTVVGMMSQAAQQRPPFEMTIVQAEEVTTLQFDPSTGAPLRGQYDALRGARTRSTGTKGTPASFAPPAVKPSEKLGEDVTGFDFPIDFGEE